MVPTTGRLQKNAAAVISLIGRSPPVEDLPETLGYNWNRHANSAVE
jgi:hypothetical protein